MESTDSVSERSASRNGRKEVDELGEFSKVATALILCYLLLIYYMDRFCIAGLLVDIQCIYQVGDDEGGYLQSAFILSFIVAAPIAGYLGDRYSRKYILVGGMFFWSCLTLGASFVPEDSFWLFLTLRALTGIGEASFSTMAPGIISDLFVQDRRTRYLAFYSFCIPMGSGLGFIVGSQVAQAAGTFRWGLRVTPILGFVGLLLIILLLRDPARGHSEGSRLRATNWADDLKYLCGNWTYISMVVSTTSVGFIAGAFASWGPKFVAVGLVAEYGDEASVDLDTVSLIFGAVTIVASILGVVAGSILSQKLRGRYPTVDPLICAIGLTAGSPLFYCMMYFARGPQIRTYLLSFFGQLIFNLNWAISADISMVHSSSVVNANVNNEPARSQYVIVPTRRATSKAIQLLCNHILGDAGSPFVIGLVSEAIKPLLDVRVPKTSSQGRTVDCDATPIDPGTADRDFTALQYALFIILFVDVVAAFAYFAASWTVVADKKRVDDAVRCDRDRNSRS